MDHPRPYVIGIASEDPEDVRSFEVIAREIAIRGWTCPILYFADPLHRVAARLAGVNDPSLLRGMESQVIKGCGKPDLRMLVEILTGCNYTPDLGSVFGGTHRDLCGKFYVVIERLFRFRDGGLYFEECSEGVTYGRFIQLLDVAMRDLFGDDVFVLDARARCAGLGSHAVIIPDVRHDNEANFVRSAGRLLHIDAAFKILSDDDGDSAPVPKTEIARLTEDLVILNDQTEGFDATLVAFAEFAIADGLMPVQ